MTSTARGLYLDLMKRCLTDWLHDDLHRLVSLPVREQGVPRAVRSKRREWPARAHTQMGLQLLDTVQFCVEEVLAKRIPGDFLEAGVWRGGASIFMRAILKAWEVEDRCVWMADSFEGLPQADPSSYPPDAGLESMLSNFARYGLLDQQVRYIKGGFQDALPQAPIGQLAILRIDGDLYQSILEALKHLYPKLAPGGYVIVDGYGMVPECKQAVHDFRAEQGIDDPIQFGDWTGIYWQRAAKAYPIAVTEAIDSREDAEEVPTPRSMPDALWRVRENWEYLAKHDPFWAIYSLPEKKGRKWGLREFFETGIPEIDKIVEYTRKVSPNLSCGEALDFGCGVGRATQALCRHFASCWGIDIAPTMIELANTFNVHPDKCRYILNEKQDLSVLDPQRFDFIYSNIVLQHMPPPISLDYISECVRLLAPSGVFVFQLPAKLEREMPFLGADGVPIPAPILAADSPLEARIAMFTVPREQVVSAIQDSGGEVLEILTTSPAGPDWLGDFYWVRKPTRSTADI